MGYGFEGFEGFEGLKKSRAIAQKPELVSSAKPRKGLPE